MWRLACARKVSVGLSLAVFLACTDPLTAQRGGGGQGGGGHGGAHIGLGAGGHWGHGGYPGNGGFYGHHGYYGGYPYWGYGLGYGFGGVYLGGDLYPYRAYYGEYAYPYYLGADANELYPELPRIIGASDPNRAELRLLVPAGADTWLEDVKTRQQGSVREFVSPPLEPDQKYTYTIRGRWPENGEVVDRIRKVAVHAGDRLTVDMRESISQSAGPSTSSQPRP